jgi:iron complex outermembrane receptor protein
MVHATCACIRMRRREWREYVCVTSGKAKLPAKIMRAADCRTESWRRSIANTQDNALLEHGGGSMKMPTKMHDARAVLSRSIFELSAGAMGCALLLLAVTTSTAQAQTTEPAVGESSLDEVVVTGIRAAIESAIAVKRDSGSIIEVISAEDIGKLPDTSIADSISRLPGLTSQRAEGRASAISLRGTDPGFTTALLNGREQVSTGDNRSIEFDQYPSELLSGVLVYKTPDARLVGQGLAGTIDLRTTRPLAYGRRAMVFNIRGEQNSQSDLGADSTNHGYRVSFSYIDQFADNTVGLTFGIARLVSPLDTEGAGTYEPWHANGVPDLSGSPNPNGVANPGVGPGVYITDGIKVRTDMGKNRRDGAMAALEWKPNDSFASILDLYYTKRDQVDNARSLEVNLGNYPSYCCDGTFPAGTVFGYSNPTIVDNTVVAATLQKRVPLVRNFLFKTQDQIKAVGWNNKFTAGEWIFAGDLSYSKAIRDEQQYETNAQYLPNLNAAASAPKNIYDTGHFSISRDNMPQLSFGLNYANPVGVQVGPTIYGAGYTKIPHVEDTLKSARVDVSRTLQSWFANVTAGINYADRTKDKVQPEANLSTKTNATGNYWQIDPKYLLAPTNLSYAGAGNILAWDVASVLAAYYNPIVYGSPSDPAFSYLIGKNWSVAEKVTTALVNGDLDHELSSSVTLKGNIGLQVVYTDQSSSALRQLDGTTTGTAIASYSDGKKYTDVLPTINLAFMLPERQAVRLGLARELARARMDQLKASSEIGFDTVTGKFGGSGGNPQLSPWRADAIDLSYEKYFSNKGYVSLAAFHKKLKSYIYNQTNGSYDFSSYLAKLSGNSFTGAPPVAIGSFTSPVNGSGGKLEGLEFAVSLPGVLLTNVLDGFGTILSISKTQSNITIQDPPGNNFITGNGLGNIPLPGLSKTVWNATAYYEKAGFSARVATRARSKYIGEVTNFANDRSFKYVKGDQITDFQAGYEFSGRVLHGMSILFQVNNLTNEPYIAYAVSETRQQDYQKYGRQFLLGVNFKIE